MRIKYELGLVGRFEGDEYRMGEKKRFLKSKVSLYPGTHLCLYLGRFWLYKELVMAAVRQLRGWLYEAGAKRSTNRFASVLRHTTVSENNYP